MHAMSQVGAQQRQNGTGLIAGASTRPASEVDGELNALEGAVQDANALVAEFVDRLTPALLPAALGAEGGVNGSAPQVVMSPLAESVRGTRQRLEATTARLRSALNRLAI